MNSGVKRTPTAEARGESMESTSELAARLSRASVKRLWNVHTAFDWPEALDDSLWSMSPELISIYGTEAYERP